MFEQQITQWKEMDTKLKVISEHFLSLGHWSFSRSTKRMRRLKRPLKKNALKRLQANPRSLESRTRSVPFRQRHAIKAWKT
ncbi:MAG: hypothetical protein CFE44_24325 [Burkholderiales bacterium PBB4]|nr:MAG: hypothetical protein CFE44_24325 [Burkholderiales bacterium PBB4]